MFYSAGKYLRRIFLRNGKGVLAHLLTPVRMIQNLSLIHIYTVDLFASETAVCLCEMLHYLGRRLPELVVQRAYREVDQRVLLHYEQSQEPFPFEKMENNWCAVCAGSIGMCALYRLSLIHI